MDVIRRNLLPIAVPMLAMARIWVQNQLSWASGFHFDCIVIAVTFAAMLYGWFVFGKYFSKMLLHVLVLGAYWVVAAIMSQMFFIAVDAALTNTPLFYEKISSMVGDKTAYLIDRLMHRIAVSTT